MTQMENSNQNDICIIDKTADPTPFGLCAFGMTTLLLSLCNAGFIGLTSPIIGMALFYGGIAMVIAGVLAWKKNDIFGFVTLGSVGFFWLSFAAILILPAMEICAAPTAMEMAAFLSVWTLFVIGLVICAFRLPKILLITLSFALLMFILLILGNVTGTELFTNLGGYSGIITGLLATYIGMAQVINTVHGKSVLPI